MDDEAFSELTDRDTWLTNRVNADNTIDSYGRRLLLFCQTTNLFLANGRLGDDRNVGQFTFSSHNGLSVVDYLLCNITDSQIIADFKILDFNEFSDHSPVYYTLSSKPIHSEVIHDDEHRTDCSQKLVYDEARLPIFRNQLLTCTAVLNELTENVNNNQIDSVVQSFTNVLFDCTCVQQKCTSNK